MTANEHSSDLTKMVTVKTKISSSMVANEWSSVWTNVVTDKTSWDELISPRLRQFAWAGLKATKALQANKLIVLLNLLEVIFIYFFRMYCFGSTFIKIWPAVAEIFHLFMYFKVVSIYSLS